MDICQFFIYRFWGQFCGWVQIFWDTPKNNQKLAEYISRKLEELLVQDKLKCK